MKANSANTKLALRLARGLTLDSASASTTKLNAAKAKPMRQPSSA